MIPHLKSADKKSLIDSYLDIIEDSEKATSNDIIERDRKKLKKILSQSKWQKQQK
jgi:hypothetical protein